jgi:hypothetical protein
MYLSTDCASVSVGFPLLIWREQNGGRHNVSCYPHATALLATEKTLENNQLCHLSNLTVAL